MKFTKMSLVAALLIGSSAFAIENTKITGDANVYYMTQDKANSALAKGDGGFFEAQNSAADIGLNLNVTTDLYKADAVSISAGAGYTVLTTLGLENNLVGNVWGSSHTATIGTGASYGQALTGAKVENSAWVNEAWVAATAGKSTVKVGRMALDTPLAFTETWSIEKNTFEAAVLINQDIPDTTLVGAFVGNGNGTPDGKISANGTTVRANLAVGGVVNTNGDFSTYGTDGAYTIAAINNSWKPLTVQAWYYDVTRVATATWLEADLNMDGILAGLQYSDITPDAAGAKTGTVFAGMIGYAMKDTFTAKFAYSATGTDGGAGANTATGTGASKLYTEAWWGYGNVTRVDTTSYNLTLEGTVADIDLGAYGTISQQNNGKNYNEATFTAAKSVGPVDATLAYIYANSAADNSYVNAIQVYLTVNF